MLQLEKVAIVTAGRVICPHCSSPDMIWCEEVTMAHRILTCDGETLKIASQGEADEIAMDERFRCSDCGEMSAIPDYLSVEFE